MAKHQCPHCNHKPYRWPSGLSRHIKEQHPAGQGPRLEFTPDRNAASSSIDTLPAPPRIADAKATAAVALEVGETPPDFAAPATAVAAAAIVPLAEIPFANYLTLIKFVMGLSEAFRDGDIAALGKASVEELKLWAQTFAQMRGHDADPKITLAIISAKIFLPIMWNVILGIKRIAEAKKAKDAKKAEEAKAAEQPGDGS